MGLHATEPLAGSTTVNSVMFMAQNRSSDSGITAGQRRQIRFGTNSSLVSDNKAGNCAARYLVSLLERALNANTKAFSYSFGLG